MTRTDAVIMIEGTSALIEKLGIVEAERFFFNLKNADPFDYTEWRKENLWKGMSANEILEAAVEHDRQYPFNRNQ